MRIASSNLSPQLLFAPGTQNLQDGFAVKKNPQKSPRQSKKARLKTAAMAQQMALPFQPEGYPLAAVYRVTHSQTSAANSETLTLRNRLRVVREFDSAISPSCAGRMVISGRMADVCAELERMSHA